MHAEEFLALCQGVKKVGAKKWRVICPRHGGGSPTLQVVAGDEGLLLECWEGGCEPKAIMESLGREYRDLFYDPIQPRKEEIPQGCSLKELAHRTQIPSKVLQEFGWRDASYDWRVDDQWVPIRTVAIPLTENGVHIRDKHRIRPSGKDKYRYKGKGKQVPLGLDSIERDVARRGELALFLTEGETDWAAMRYANFFNTLGMPGSESFACLQAEHVEGWKEVILLGDADQGGETFNAKMRAWLEELEFAGDVKVIHPPDGKDVCSWRAEKGNDGFQAAMRKAYRQARSADADLDPTVGMDEVEELGVHFLWEPRLPLSLLTVFAGKQGSGKGLVAAAIASAVTNGAKIDRHGFEQGKVVLFSREDHEGIALQPRLRAAGAKLGLVRALPFETDFHINEEGIAMIRRVLEIHRPRLLVLDPIMNMLDDRMDTASQNAVVGALSPLTVLAEQFQTAIMATMHIRKGASESGALDLVMGSAGFTTLARSVLMVFRDPEDEDLRQGEKAFVLTHPKTNYGIEAPSLRYRITTSFDLPGVPLVTWEGRSRYKADELAEMSELTRRRIRRAMQLLRVELRPGKERKASELVKLFREAGLSRESLEHGLDALGARLVKRGYEWMYEAPREYQERGDDDEQTEVPM